MAFAHGKLLLFGEHAVVYGEPALAAALTVGVSATVTGRTAARMVRDVASSAMRFRILTRRAISRKTS
jgi:mevalonate kinase